MFVARQAARSGGAIIPPTPMNERQQDAGRNPMQSDADKFAQPQLPSVSMKSKVRLQNFSLFTITRELVPQEAQQMFVQAFQRIMNNERRAVQGGAGNKIYRLQRSRLGLTTKNRARSAENSRSSRHSLSFYSY